MAVPVITSISSTGGPAAGGTTITITGTDLGTPTGVAFGAVPAASFAGVSATQAFAVSPAGTGTVHVTLTTAGGTSAGIDFTYGDMLFTVAESRLFDKAQLTSAASFPDATIIAKEAEIREWLTRACGCDFIPTVHADEYHDGDGTGEITLDWPLPTTITAVSYRSPGSSTWTALTAGELAVVQAQPTGLLAWEFGYFPKGRNTVKVTYTAGYATPPALISRAALRIAVMELPATTTPWTADGYEAGGTTYSFNRGDGYAGSWSSDPDVMKAIRLYTRQMPGIA